MANSENGKKASFKLQRGVATNLRVRAVREVLHKLARVGVLKRAPHGRVIEAARPVGHLFAGSTAFAYAGV